MLLSSAPVAFQQATCRVDSNLLLNPGAPSTNPNSIPLGADWTRETSDTVMSSNNRRRGRTGWMDQARAIEINGPDCPICRNQTTQPTLTRCGHLFCQDCLVEWMAHQIINNETCPTCRGDISRWTQTEIIRHLGVGEERLFLVRFNNGATTWLFRELIYPSSLLDNYQQKLAQRRRSARLNLNYEF